MTLDVVSPTGKKYLWKTTFPDGEVEYNITNDRVSQMAEVERLNKVHHPEKISINHADDVFDVLKSAYVIADYEQRKAQIRTQIEDAAKAVNAVVAMDEDLLEEVTSLVEWPVTLTATFEEAFLDVPAEALIYTMKDDQKYFPLLDQNGKLLNKFLFVSNIESKDPSVVISGNEKVVRPRLADAQFFFETDKKKTLESRLESLDSVLFQKQLGTLKDKSMRISELTGYIAEQLGADKVLAQRAGLLSKTDLMTEMVMEFTDVQGVMGMHYARHDGEAEDVAIAQNEQYMPRFAGDNLPTNLISCAVAIADKFDTLVGIFGIGQAPKGDKDPFALRRAAIGALRIMVEKELPLDILDLVAKSQTLFGDKLTNLNVSADVFEFMLGRFRAWYQDEGIEVDVIQAVLARRPTKPVDFDRRVKAVSHFRTLDAAEALAAANKRVGNILAKNDITSQGSVDESLLSDDAEKVLASQVAKFATDLAPLYADGNYQEALSQLAGIRQSVLDEHRKADIRLHRVQRGNMHNCSVRIFINSPNADIKTPTENNDNYVGEVTTFHGTCYGGPGHCALPLDKTRRTDQRKLHHHEPRNYRVDASQAIQKQISQGATDLSVHLVVVGMNGEPIDNALFIDGVSLNFFD